MNISEFLTQFPHGVIVIESGSHRVLHMVGYQKPATDTDLLDLSEELEVDEGIGLVGRTDLELIPVTGETWRANLLAFVGEH